MLRVYLLKQHVSEQVNDERRAAANISCWCFFVPNRIQTKKTFPNWQTVRLTGHVHGVSISSVLSTKDAKYSSPKLGVVIAKKSSAFSETGANASSLKTAFLSSSWQLFFFPKRDNLNSSLS